MYTPNLRAEGFPNDRLIAVDLQANLTRVFDTEVYVDTHDLTGRLLVLPLSGRVRDRLASEE